MATLEEQVNRRVLLRVVQLRESMGMEKKDFAELLSISPQGYSPYESGVRPFSIAQVFTLARALGKPVAYHRPQPASPSPGAFRGPSSPA